MQNNRIYGYGAKISGISLNPEKLYKTACDLSPELKVDVISPTPTVSETLKKFNSGIYNSPVAVLGEIVSLELSKYHYSIYDCEPVTDTKHDVYIISPMTRIYTLEKDVRENVEAGIRKAFSCVSDNDYQLRFDYFSLEPDDSLLLTEEFVVGHGDFLDTNRLFPDDLFREMCEGLLRKEHTDYPDSSIRDLTKEIIHRFVYDHITCDTIPYDLNYPVDSTKALMLTPDPVTELTNMIYRDISESIYDQIEQAVEDNFPKYLTVIRHKYNICEISTEKNN